MNIKRFLFILLCIFSVGSFSACGKETAPALNCPFTDMGWENTIDDIIAAEGENYSTYNSVYGGLCYTYPKEYEGKTGTIKYMFDEQERLMSVAWAYSIEDTDSLLALYDSISASVNAQYGDSGYNADGVGNYGEVWYLENGDIILSTMITADNSALQYAYLHPAVSNTEKRTNNTKQP